MKNLHEFKSRKEWEESVWGYFVEEISDPANKKSLSKFLNCVLTNKEKKLIINRLIAIRLLGDHKTYREIGELLWLSPNTISMAKKAIQKENGYQSYYERRQEDDRDRAGEDSKVVFAVESIKWLWDYFANFPWPSYSGKGRWKFLEY